MKRRLLKIATLLSLPLFVLSLGMLAANMLWGHRYGYVGHRPQYVVALDELSVIVERQDGSFTLKIPLLLTSIVFAILPAAWLDRLQRRRRDCAERQRGFIVS